MTTNVKFVSFLALTQFTLYDKLVNADIETNLQTLESPL
jgi:hypothetical protein